MTAKPPTFTIVETSSLLTSVQPARCSDCGGIWRDGAQADVEVRLHRRLQGPVSLRMHEVGDIMSDNNARTIAFNLANNFFSGYDTASLDQPPVVDSKANDVYDAVLSADERASIDVTTLRGKYRVLIYKVEGA